MSQMQRKRINKKIRESPNQPHSMDNGHWGDEMGIKQEGIIRIAYQNIRTQRY